MRTIYLMLQLLISASLFACCSKVQIANEQSISNADTTMTLKITIGQTAFKATLFDNATAIAFKKQLPLTISMNELNGNEKYGELPTGIVRNATNPGTIQNGDVMLYGSSTLVLFYKSFSTSYSYTRIGRIENPAGLEAALGSGNVIVKYELE